MVLPYKKRYAVVHLTFEKAIDSLSKQDIYHALKDSICLNFGDVGLGRASLILQVLFYEKTTGVAIIRYDYQSQQVVLGSIAFITRIQEVMTKWRTVRICGSFKSCKETTKKIYKERAVALGIVPDMKTIISRIQDLNG